VELVRFAVFGVLSPPNVSHRRHSERSDSVPYANHLDLLSMAFDHNSIVLFGGKFLPIVGLTKGRLENPLGNVRGIFLDELSHGRWSKDPDLVDQTGSGSGGKRSTGEAEKVELIARGKVVDDKVVGFDDVLEQSRTISPCASGFAHIRSDAYLESS
jgi:hypothetical protein